MHGERLDREIKKWTDISERHAARTRRFADPAPIAHLMRDEGWSSVWLSLRGYGFDNRIEVLHNQHPERIRLKGIDCPEKGQAYGTRAKRAASDLAFGKEVTVQTHGLDKYGRTIADVLLLDGTNVNHTLVKDGWCWWYRIHAPRNTELERLEKDTREAKKGLWVDQAHVPSWEWRKRHR